MDSWWWKASSSGCYSKILVYRLCMEEDSMDEAPNVIFQDLWQISFPKKVFMFLWKTFKNRLPSKENLKKSNIIVRDEDMLCPCLQKSETIPLFFYCELASKVWNECYSWIAPDFATTSPGDMEAHYWYIKWLGRSKLEGEIWQYI